ncbi:hypothetical protein ANN_22298, partial [Periplaneta americana]
MTLQNKEVRVTAGGLMSQNFKVTTGIRHGDDLSAVLFNLTMDEVLKEFNLSGTTSLNKPIDQILKREDRVRHIKSLRRGWLGQVERMKYDRTPKYLLINGIIGVGKKGKPRKRWLQNVEMDLRVWELEDGMNCHSREVISRRFSQPVELRCLLLEPDWLTFLYFTNFTYQISQY